jgi:hypothetical protein
MEYRSLSPEERVQIVDGRLKQLEAEHYTTALNRRSLESATDMTPEDQSRLLAESDEKLETLERAIEIHRRERAELDGAGE